TSPGILSSRGDPPTRRSNMRRSPSARVLNAAPRPFTRWRPSTPRWANGPRPARRCSNRSKSAAGTSRTRTTGTSSDGSPRATGSSKRLGPITCGLSLPPKTSRRAARPTFSRSGGSRGCRRTDPLRASLPRRSSGTGLAALPAGTGNAPDQSRLRRRPRGGNRRAHPGGSTDSASRGGGAGRRHLSRQGVEFLRDFGELAAEALAPRDRVDRGLPLPPHHGAVDVVQMLADPLLAGDRSALLRRHDLLSNLLELRGSVGRGLRLRIRCRERLRPLSGRAAG